MHNHGLISDIVVLLILFLELKKVILLSMCLICISRSKDDTYFFNLSNKTTFFGKFLELAYEEIIGKKIEADYERKRSITKIIIFVNARPNISLVLYIWVFLKVYSLILLTSLAWFFVDFMGATNLNSKWVLCIWI